MEKDKTEAVKSFLLYAAEQDENKLRGLLVKSLVKGMRAKRQRKRDRTKKLPPASNG